MMDLQQSQSFYAWWSGRQRPYTKAEILADGAIHIPLDQLPSRLGELDPDQDLYVICRTGGRSFRAAQWLTGQGYAAINVAGGMDQWLESGKPLVSDNGLKPLVL